MLETVNPKAIAESIFTIEIEELTKVKAKLTDDFSTLCTTIVKSAGKVVITGVGKSGLIGQKIAATLASTGTTAIFMHSTEGLHGDLGMITGNDVVIAISNSGRSDEILAIMPSIKQIGAEIAVMTGDIHSPLAAYGSFILNIGVDREACPINLAPMSSTTATLVMGDALAAALIRLKQFKPENFAIYHPGGSLGRRLLTRVKDVMHSGENLPKVSPETSVDMVLMEMTAKRLGAVCVMNGIALAGLITEGDIRRALSNKEHFFSMNASDIMTKNPTVISPEEMAVEALATMENRESQISVLPVVAEEKLVGIVRIHDLLMVKG